jgi:NAD(P)-dependent dehydrogenase (short-subunit alcohol dehydrogenase family)
MAPTAEGVPDPKSARLSVPIDLPAWTSDRLSVAAFNRLYFRNGAAKAGTPHLVHWDPYFFPLDGVVDWNRIYGREGFVQHQCVIPGPAARAVIAEIIERVSRRGNASFLAVLKQLGPGAGLMSFPMEGYTLSLDLHVTDELFPLLAEIDRAVTAAGGRLYLAKDARQSRRDLLGAATPTSAGSENSGGTIGSKRVGSNPDFPRGSASIRRRKNRPRRRRHLRHGRATALRYAQAGWRVRLAARDEEGARRNAQDIATRTGVEVEVHAIDILEIDRLAAFVDGLPGLPDTVVSVVGELGDQAKAQADPTHASLVLRANFEGPALLLGLFAERFSARGSGALVGVSSVAGDRGRGSNYVYGAAKAGFSAFLSGLRNRLATTGVRVVTVKPGFVRTRMTAGMKLPPLLTAEPTRSGGRSSRRPRRAAGT